MSYPLIKIFRDSVKKFINGLPLELRQKFAVATLALSKGDFDSIYIKQLRKEIKEVKIQRYRLIFFTYQNSIYFVGAFLKKSNKAPKKEIESAEKYYKLITNN